MSAMELVQFMVGSGVLAQGLAAARWAIRMETRVKALELKEGMA